MKKWMFLFFILSSACGFSGSVLLINDSIYDLKVEIRATSGDVLGSFNIKAGEQKNYMVNLSRSQLQSPSTSANSITPYMVIWRCSYKGIYSVNSNVSPGALAQANSGDGGKYCESKPEEEKDLEYRCPPCPPCPPCPVSPGQDS